MGQQTTPVQAPAQAAAAALSGYTKDEIWSAVPTEGRTPAVPLRVSLRDAFESEPREIVIDAALLAGGKGVDLRWLPVAPELDTGGGEHRHYLTSGEAEHIMPRRQFGPAHRRVQAAVHRFLKDEPDSVWLTLGHGAFSFGHGFSADDAYAIGVALIQAARAAQLDQLKQFLTGEAGAVASTDPVEA